VEKFPHHFLNLTDEKTNCGTFHQDSATARTASDSKAEFTNIFGPPQLTEPTPGYYLWGCPKEEFYKNHACTHARTQDELKEISGCASSNSS
jgi:hypothetical protein